MTPDRTPNPEARRRALDGSTDEAFGARCVDYLDGRLDAACAAAFKAELDTDPAKRQAFVLMMYRTQLIAEAFRGQAVAEPSAVAGRIEPRPGGRVGRPWLALAAALLLAAAAVAVYLGVVTLDEPTVPPDAPGSAVATLVEATAAVTVNDDLASPGERYPAGSYAIDGGSASFLLRNRVSVRLEGASRLAVADEMNATLAVGSAVFECPPGAVGYTVHLPGGARVVDRGTRFRIDVEPDGSARVIVLSGRVELICTDLPPIALAEGESRRTLSDGAPAEPADDPYARWLVGAEARAAAPSVLAHYTFDGPAAASGSVVSNSAPDSTVGGLELVGGRLVDGRVPGKLALRCDRGGAALSIPGALERLTLAAWVRVERAAPANPSPLVAANGWFEPGVTMWQLSAPGARPQIGQWGEPVLHATAPASLPLNEWTHVALTLDARSGTVRHFINGGLVHEEQLPGLRPAVLDAAQVGAWAPAERFAPRRLPGVIDELTVYADALAPRAVLELYESGRVGPIDTAPRRVP